MAPPDALARVPPAEAMPDAAPLNPQQMARALHAYRELQATLDRSMPDQIIKTGDGRYFRRKGYWRATAFGFNVTVEIVSERREVFGTLANGHDDFGYLITCRAATASGRSQIGDGACTAGEKSTGRMRPTEHNVRSHAFTRAFNRAVSNLVGFGEVSAEEIEPEDDVDQAHRGGAAGRAAAKAPAVEESSVGAAPPALESELPPKPPPGPVSADHVVYVTDLKRTPTRNPKVVKYTLTIAGGPDWPANQNTVSTINRKWADLAADAMKANGPIRLRTKRTEYGYDVASLEALDDQGNPLPLTSDDIPFR